MTFDRDPDRLIDAWLDEGPRSFSPRLLDRTLADIHHHPTRRHRWMPWSTSAMNLTLKTGLAASLVLAVALGTGALLPLVPRNVLGPAASPTAPVPSSGPSSSPAPSDPAAPTPVATPTFLEGQVPFLATDWLLVGRASSGRGPGEPAYVAALPGVPATLRFERDTFAGSTGCRTITGTHDAAPKGKRTVAAQLTLDPFDSFACDDPVGTQDRVVLQALEGAGAVQVSTGGYEILASGLTEADLDPALLAHYRDLPDLTRLVIRDQSGEGTLIYAPVSTDPGEQPEPSFAAGEQPMTGTEWRLEGFADADRVYTAADLASEASLVFTSIDGTDRFSTWTGCRWIDGDWGMDGVRPAAVTARLSVSIGERGSTENCPASMVVQDRAISDGLDRVGGITVAVQSPTDLAPGVGAADLDPVLRARFAASPDLTRLVLRDASGEALLIFVPLAG